ncbi:MAG: flavodoxin domain-containing protein [Algiphilus sp.]
MPTARILYASTHGQTEKIAGYMAGRLRAQGMDATACDVQAADVPAQWMQCDVLFIGCSVYVRRFQRALDAFIRQHRDALNAHPNAVFFSVSASAANAPGGKAVAALVATYLASVGWQPADCAHFAGAVKYPRYGRLTRWMM